MTIKLSELKAARAAMTPGPWHLDNSTIYGGNDEVGDFEVAEFSNDGSYDDTGIVATHNAADVLIEIAEAAREHMLFGACEDEAAAAAEQRLRAALAKVTL